VPRKDKNMSIEKKLSQSILQVLSDLYGQSVDEKSIQLQATRKEFDGDLTLVVFPFLKISKKTPELTAEEIGSKLKEIQPIVENYNVIKGFLNLTIAKKHWVSMLNDMAIAEKYGFTSVGENSPLYMVEYSSPNTNKPLHLGHVRNNLLGYSLCRILEANGFRVVKTNIVNDRGIHICKSMLAWQKFGNEETPESSGKKGDHLVGDYYVKFDLEYKAQVKELMSQGKSEEEAKKEAPLMVEAQAMLKKWEDGDPEVRELWNKMNSWVYAGFDETYQKIGVGFDKIYYESQTYLDGKEKVNEGLSKGLFYRREDGSVWAD
jgi:arginyl-tRNA synthetase